MESLPLRGEWIEIGTPRGALRSGYCLSLCGESGLKFLCPVLLIQPIHVSPFAGRVD